MNIKEIKELLQLMQDHQLTEIEIEKDGASIKLKKRSGHGLLPEESLPAQSRTYPTPPAASQPNPGVTAAAETQSSAEAANIERVKSPMVGTFYTAPAPDQPPYAAVGKKVQEGDVLCIVEAMKLMNEIKSEVSGTVTEICVNNGQPVEFDQLLFKIQKG